jgi:hypothetical protein
MDIDIQFEAVVGRLLLSPQLQAPEKEDRRLDRNHL